MREAGLGRARMPRAAALICLVRGEKFTRGRVAAVGVDAAVAADRPSRAASTAFATETQAGELRAAQREAVCYAGLCYCVGAHALMARTHALRRAKCSRAAAAAAQAAHILRICETAARARGLGLSIALRGCDGLS
jgi:hypothetical protein